MAETIKLPELAWYGAREVELNIPESWKLEVCNMAGFNAPAMSPENIKRALKQPLKSPTIRELARDKNEVVVIFDDMSRITRVDQIVPYVVEELTEAGIPDNKIRFISALGCHGAMERSDFVKKLGENIVSRFPVYNHNPFSNFCSHVGTTSKGIRIAANAEVMKCDLKIGIGSVEPHMMVGFGGGSKIILPGITSLETNESFHWLSAKINCENPIMMGISANNPMREQIEEAGVMVGLNFKIDCIFNMWGDTTNIYAGLPQAVFYKGADVAQKHYCSSRAKDKDIVIANIYIKVNEPHSALATTIPSINKNGGDLVLICNSPEGVVTHYLMGSFGLESGAPLSNYFKIPDNINRIIILSEYPDHNFARSLMPAEKVIQVNSWDKALKILTKTKRSENEVQVAVYPNSEIQYCSPA